MIGKLLDGSKGFDCNTRVLRAAAEAFYSTSHSFCVRYVRREQRHSYDISPAEARAIRDSGLALMLVQHVAPPGWRPTATLGRTYGEVAREEAQMVSYPRGAVLWCDLEGVNAQSNAWNVTAYCNAWYDAVKAGGYSPGLYVGDSCGLNANELYYSLRFQRYWSAYNLNRDNYPAVRGVQMRQKAYPSPANRVSGIPFEYDVNVTQPDRKGGSPVMWLPELHHV